jgi:hypothetical protein
MMSATSTSTLGFLTLTVGLIIAAWLATIMANRLERGASWPTAFRRSLRGFVIEAGALLVLVACLFLAFVLRTTYNVHEALLTRIEDLTGEGNGNPYVIFQNNEYASIVNLAMAFHILEASREGCHLSISAEQDNALVESDLRGIARAVGCDIAEPNPILADDKRFQNVPARTTVIQIAGARREAMAFATMLDNVLNVKLSGPPPTDDEGLVTIRIGNVNVWRQR